MKNEEYYDTNIAPKLAEIAQDCENNGMSLIAFCEFNKGEIGDTITIQQGSHFSTRLVHMAVQSKGNVDSLIWGIMKYASKYGHSSITLKQLGVPEKPQ